MSRKQPNIIITGTPGTGKTTHCEDLAEKVAELKHLSVNQIVKDKGCHEGWDEDYQSWIVDEDKVGLNGLFSYHFHAVPRPLLSLSIPRRAGWDKRERNLGSYRHV